MTPVQVSRCDEVSNFVRNRSLLTWQGLVEATNHFLQLGLPSLDLIATGNMLFDATADLLSCKLPDRRTKLRISSLQTLVGKQTACVVDKLLVSQDSADSCTAHLSLRASMLFRGPRRCVPNAASRFCSWSTSSAHPRLWITARTPAQQGPRGSNLRCSFHVLNGILVSGLTGKRVSGYTKTRSLALNPPQKNASETRLAVLFQKRL